jgi:hypothetical protein
MQSPFRVLAALALCVLAVPAFAAIPRATLYVTRIDPADRAARDFARPGYGGGIDISWPISGSQGMVSAIGGIEISNLLSKVKAFQDQVTLLRVEQHTDQVYGRLFVGGELGPHGNGFLEPYANAALGLVFYSINTDVVIPNDSDPDNPITQHLGGKDEAAFGWSAGTGANLNFGRWGIDGGVRFLKQYGVPQQLGDGAVTIQPAYLQYRLGVSIAIPR